MSEELYYRGSCSYETAVQNQLARIRNSNESLRYSIQDMEYGIRSDIRQSTYAIVASQEMLASTFSHGFNSVNNTLSIGFDRMSMKMAEIANAINAMTEEVCSRLDEIHDIVNNPLLTQSRELYRRALSNFEKGYYEEALEDIKSAVEKNKTDFISWHLLGQIYLFGAGKFSNVINIDEAENAFINAAKYIDADIGQSEEADNLASEIYYYLGYTRLVKSNDMLVEGKADESEKKLIEAEVASGRAYKISKENILAGYEQAKELHFLGHDDKAINILKEIIKAEPTFSLKASNDKNFESMWDKIDALIETLRDEVAAKAKEKVNTIVSLVETKLNTYKKEIKAVGYPEREEFEKICKFIDIEPEINSISDETHKMLVEHTLGSTFSSLVKEEGELLDIQEYLESIEGGFSYIGENEFSEKCKDTISTVKATLKEYTVLENYDYLSAVKLYDELIKKDSSENFSGELTQDVDILVKVMKKIYSEETILAASTGYRDHIDLENYEESHMRGFHLTSVICAVIAGIGLLAAMAMFFLGKFGIQLALVFASGVVLFFSILDGDEEFIYGKDHPEVYRFAKLPMKIFGVVALLMAAGLCLTNHWFYGVVTAVIAMAGFELNKICFKEGE